MNEFKISILYFCLSSMYGDDLGIRVVQDLNVGPYKAKGISEIEKRFD